MCSSFRFFSIVSFFVVSLAIDTLASDLPPIPAMRGIGADRSAALSDAVAKAVAFYSIFALSEESASMREVKPSTYRILRDKESEGNFEMEIQPLFSSRPRFEHAGRYYFPFEEERSLNAMVHIEHLRFKGGLNGSHLSGSIHSELGSILRDAGFEVVGSAPRFIMSLSGELSLSQSYDRKIGRKNYSFQDLSAILNLRVFHVFDGEELGSLSLTKLEEISTSKVRTDIGRFFTQWVRELGKQASVRFLKKANEIPPRVRYAEVPVPEEPKMDPPVKPQDDEIGGSERTKVSETSAEDKMPDWLVLDDEPNPMETDKKLEATHKKFMDKMQRMRVESLFRQVKLMKSSDLPWLKKAKKP
jgi:hypothetical protein